MFYWLNMLTNTRTRSFCGIVTILAFETFSLATTVLASATTAVSTPLCDVRRPFPWQLLTEVELRGSTIAVTALFASLVLHGTLVG